MGRWLSPRQWQFLALAFGGMYPLLHVFELVGTGTVPWTAIAVVGAITGVLVGPLVWFVRDRVPAQRREDMALVAGGVVVVLVPIAVGLSLGFEVPSFVPSFDALILGGVVGNLLVLIVEWTVVPERLRAAQQG